MPSRSKSSPKDSAANLGFGAKLWLAADSRGVAETAEGNRSNNMDAAEPERPGDSQPQAARKASEARQYKHVVRGLIFLSGAKRRQPAAGCLQGELSEATSSNPTAASSATSPSVARKNGRAGTKSRQGGERWSQPYEWQQPKESNATTSRLARMNFAIRGIEADIGKEYANTFRHFQHPDLRVDYLLANPPFHDSAFAGCSTHSRGYDTFQSGRRSRRCFDAYVNKTSK